MLLYQFFQSVFPERVARIITCVVLAVLLTVVVFCAFEPQLSFKYGKM